ncbi:MAG: methyltransferase domain-containing protein [Pseudomonadota bacterium]
MSEHQPIHLSEQVEYTPGMSFEAFLKRTAARHPFLYEMIQRPDDAVLDRLLMTMNALSWEFEEDGDGGRGTVYNVAQKVADNRARGMTRLLQLFSPSGDQMPGPDTVILDVLAGDGTVSRFARTLKQAPTIISADLSGLMVEACLLQGLPCLRQPASDSLLKDGVLDGVLIAYGSHHMDANGRTAAAAEARRTLKPGGRFVLHDFESGGPMDAFFADVVHPFSATGHPHPHFSRAEMQDLLDGAGFRDIVIFEMPDPFQIPGNTEAAARAGMLAHLWHMYGLVKLGYKSQAERADLEARVNATLGQIKTQRDGTTWRAHLHRSALVAVGTA